MAKNRIQVVVPALIDTKEFHPTCVMQKVLLTHLAEMGDRDCEELTNPPKILTALGHDRSNWYKWTQRDSSTIKLYLERFDNEYKPSLRQVHSLDQGQPPPEDVEAAIARSRARIEVRKISASQAGGVSNS
ncbi:MAG: hypothetical protein ACYTBV_10000 [Planctomycetota bacterium]|jgi:hypothetical protein